MPSTPLILVVDDVVAIREELIASANHHGIAAHGAPDLAEARRRLRTGRYDLILLDLKLPEGDGLALLPELTRIEPRAPAVAFLSGLNEDILGAAGDVAAELGLEVLGTLGKPIQKASLLELFSRLEQKPRERPDPELPAGIERHEFTEGLAQGRLTSYLQPQYCLRSGRLVGFESLARWKHRESGQTLPPSAFGAYLDDPEFAWPVFEQIVRHVLSHASELQTRFGAHLRFSINAGPPVFGHPRFPVDLVKACTDVALPIHALTIELTESAPSLSVEQRLGLAQARIAGFGISLDDFGAGSAGLTRLAQLPLTEVKVDSWFIRNATSDQRRQALLRDIAILCNHRAIESVIEGIEDQAMLQMAQRFGFDVAQGYLFGHPVPIEQAMACAGHFVLTAMPPQSEAPGRVAPSTEVTLAPEALVSSNEEPISEPSAWCLIVDDDPDIRDEMSAILNDEGVTCWLASTVRDAEWQLANIDDVAVIFIDVDLPDGDGLQLLQHPVFLERQIAPIPIILTGHGNDTTANQAREHHAEYLEKPVSREQIRKAFKKACALSPSRNTCQSSPTVAIND